MKLPLKQLRENKGVTQLELSRVLGVVPSAIGMWEQGRRLPDYDNLKKIARYFNVTIDYLLGNDDAQNVKCADEDRVLSMYRVLNDTDRETLSRVIAALSNQENYRQDAIVRGGIVR